MASPAENLAIIKRKAMAYALANGGTPADGEAFGNTMGGISWVESRLGQAPVGDNGDSHGLFHTNIGGRNLSGIGQRATSNQQLAAVLSDPNVDVDNSLPELWQHFRQHGGAAGFARDPNMFTAQVALTGQRPRRSAWETVTNSGGYRDGVQIAMGQAAPTAGSSPLQAAAGLAPATLNDLVYRGEPNVMQNLPYKPGSEPTQLTLFAVNRQPVQGQVTSKFGSAFPMDSGATYQGQQYAHFNKGVDFGAAGGSPVTAVVGGTVKLAADDGSGWGPRVVVVDQEGYEHSYGHLGQLNVKPGQQIQAGQQIGVVGSGTVGTSTGEHLSYDVFKNGEPVDPSPWLGFDARDNPAIPAGQAPAYLSGARAAAGGAGMAQTGSSFYQQQLAAAQAEYEKLKTEQAALNAKANKTPEEEARAKYLNGDPLLDQPSAVDETLARVFAIQKTINDMPAGPEGADPVKQASAIAGIQAAQNEHSRWIFDTFTGLIDQTFQNQLGVANAMSTIMRANEENIQAAVASRVRNHEISSADAMNIVQAEAMKQAAEAARFGQALTLAGMVNENDWKIAERQLPAGQDFVPLLGPDDPLAQVMKRVNINFPGLAVQKTDFNRLDLRNTIQDANQIVPQTVPLSIGNLNAQYNASKNLPVYNPREITAAGIGLPNAPDMSQFAGAIPGFSAAGGIDADDLINRILGRGPYAPPPQQQAPAAPPSTTVLPSTGTQPSEPAGYRTPNRVIEPAEGESGGSPDMSNPQPTGAAAASTGRGLAGLTGVPQTVDALRPAAEAVVDAGEDIADILKKLGFGAANAANAAARAPVVSGIVGNVNKARRWLR